MQSKYRIRICENGVRNMESKSLQRFAVLKLKNDFEIFLYICLLFMYHSLLVSIINNLLHECFEDLYKYLILQRNS